MNFLAHLYLADDDGPSRIGNLLPDLVRGRLPRDLDPRLAAGVRQHRRVDAFTDTHPLFARSRARLRDRHGIFSGILVDVFYDHFLARAWQRYHPAPLGAFVAEVHADFTAHAHLMPERMRHVVHHMREQDWLGGYAHVAGIELTLRRMSQRFAHRFNREVRLERAVDDLVAQHDALADDFAAFFPQLIAYARRPKPVQSAAPPRVEGRHTIPGAALRSAPACPPKC